MQLDKAGSCYEKQETLVSWTGWKDSQLDKDRLQDKTC